MLRGFAALGVMLFHFTFFYHLSHPAFAPSLSLSFGHFGVDLFFMISGFVIFMTLERASSVRDFAVSRFARLYPVFWIALLLAVVLLPLAGGQVPSMRMVLANATMEAPLFGAPFVDVVYWSLS
jgi:peptidoglycan/LPS O-acetylase OafA/YrhL